jgi:tetratricopeptide (TPR) repeat protein
MILLNDSAMVLSSDMEPRTDKRNEIIAGIIIIAIILIGIAYFFSKSAPEIPLPTSSATSTSEAATSTSGAITITGSTASSSGYTITPIYATSSAPVAPNYKTPLTFSASAGLTSDEESSLQSQFAAAQATLAQSPEDFNSWIELGDLRKQAGDYAGAAADWQYMSELYPTNVVSNANLGDLYTNYLPDYPKAAAAYKAQIAIDPTDVYIYDDLFSLYTNTNQYPQSTAVITAMLKAGIAANPGATELKADLAKYQ